MSDASPAPDAFGHGLRNAHLVLSLLLGAATQDVDRIRPLLHPELEVHAIPGLAPARGYSSRDEFLSFFAEARRIGETITPDIKSLRVMDNGRVLVEGVLRVVNAGADARTDAWFVYQCEDGMIKCFGNYLDESLAESAAVHGFSSRR